MPLSAYAIRLAEHDLPLDRYIVEYHQARGIDLSIDAILRTALKQGGALLLLDGLDEVQETARRRLVIDRVVDFFSLHQAAGNKFVLTSRIIGYKEVRTVVGDLQECTLIDLNAEEIRLFVAQWTQAIEHAASDDSRGARAAAEREEQELLDAIARNPGVQRLAVNPLLLTILVLMKRQGVILPERRVELYENYVATLLKHWNLARGLGRPPTRDLDIQETLRILAPLALWMQEVSAGIGLVKQGDLERQLVSIFQQRGEENAEWAAANFLKDVQEYAGLLLERGPRAYGFIHLTFLEYLAAVALARRGQRDTTPITTALAQRVGDANWHEVSLLTIGYVGLIQQRDEAASEILSRLITQDDPLDGRATVLAGECVLDVWPSGVSTECRQKVRRALLALIRNPQHRQPTLRVEAGRALAKLGDPRTEVLDPRRIEWCEIPAGPFLMGEEGDEYLIDYDYRISRYAITVTQFEHFVEAGGYCEPAYWVEAQAAGIWSTNGVKGHFDGEPRIKPVDYGEPFNLPNHPVVGITWYEMLAFCRWLTEQPAEQGQLHTGYSIQLPNEAEWEKAARGEDGRDYPWPGRATPNHANYDASQIETSSALGCFPNGVSPYGVEEMSGNVWEWTRSLAGELPYPTGKRERQSARGFERRQRRCAGVAGRLVRLQ